MAKNQTGASGPIRSIKDAVTKGFNWRMFGGDKHIRFAGNRSVSGTLLLLNPDRMQGKVRGGKEPWRVEVPFTGKLDFSKAKA